MLWLLNLFSQLQFPYGTSTQPLNIVNNKQKSSSKDFNYLLYSIYLAVVYSNTTGNIEDS